LNRTAKLSTEPSALYEGSLDSLQWDALLLAARVGDDGILYVFPQPCVLPQVNLNRDPLAVVVGDELDSFHVSILPHHATMNTCQVSGSVQRAAANPARSGRKQR